jgi:hypothetical protein
MAYLTRDLFESVPMPKVVTANILSTGHVVFLGAGGTWVEAVEHATLYADAAAAEAGMAIARRDADRSIIVEPFVTDRGPGTDGKPAMTLRDTIRAHGPTIKYLPADPAAARG